MKVSDIYMKVKTAASYNLDLLCFMNIMTANQTFTDPHKESFEKFYPLISDKVKRRVSFLNKMNLAGLFGMVGTSLISCLDDFQNKDLLEMLGRKSQIKKLHKKSTNPFPPHLYFMSFRLIDRMAIPLVNELEAAGFKDFWYTNRLPLLQERCNELDSYFVDCKVSEAVSCFKNIDNSDFTIYVCSFAKPMGVKLCGNNMIFDYSYDKNDDFLETLAHELLHPLVRHKSVKPYVKALEKLPWVQTGYKNQKLGMTYRPMEMYIEENIVSPLGYYIAAQLGADLNPKDELAKRAQADTTSQVIAPHFYDYLCENPKDPALSFDDYFIAFVDLLSNP